MPRGRPPTPTYLKLIKGTSRASRSKPKQAAVDRSFGPPQPPPAFLSVEAREEWDAQCETLHKLGMLTSLDGAIFSAYTQSYGRWRQAEEVLARMAKEDETDRAGLLVRNTATGKTVENLMVGIARAAMADAVKYAAEIGLTPSSRTRVRPEPPPHDDDPATKYLT